jgi:hypothetical protein
MSLQILRDTLAAHGGTLAQVLVDDTDSGYALSQRASAAEATGDDESGGVPTPVGDAYRAEDPRGESTPPGLGAPQLAARGPRVVAHAAEYELLLEMILEGSLLHYGHPRVVATDDRDLALLLGDQLYALGLARLADLGDLESVSELSDLISLLAQAELERDLPLARAIWEAGAAAIGWGSTPEHESAKELARQGDASAVSALIQSAGRDVAQASGARRG